MSESGQNAKYSQRADVFRCSPTANIRCERRLRHAESQALQLAMPACFTVNEIGRVDPSVNDSSTPSARLQIALQKRPLIDCRSGYDFAGGNLNSKAVTTAGDDVFVRDRAGIRRVVAIPVG
jgi:hypothetical protein